MAVVGAHGIEEHYGIAVDDGDLSAGVRDRRHLTTFVESKIS
jgi:hypothetical protein